MSGRFRGTGVGLLSCLLQIFLTAFLLWIGLTSLASDPALSLGAVTLLALLLIGPRL